MYESKQDIEKARAYIAGPFFSPTQIEKIEQVERALERNPFVEAFFSPMHNQLENIPFGSTAWKTSIFAQDIHNVQWANVVVAVADMDGQDTDSGTAFELGFAFASGKPVILIYEGCDKVNVMLTESTHAFLDDITKLEDYNFLKMPKSDYSGDVI